MITGPQTSRLEILYELITCMYFFLAVSSITNPGTTSFDTKYAPGFISIQMPLFLGTLHPDSTVNIWRNRVIALPSRER